MKHCKRHSSYAYNCPDCKRANAEPQEEERQDSSFSALDFVAPASLVMPDFGLPQSDPAPMPDPPAAPDFPGFGGGGSGGGGADGSF